MVPNITIEEIANKLDRKLASEAGSNHIWLVKEFGLNNLVDSYVEAFPSIQNSAGRIEIMFWITRYARVNPKVANLAQFALADRSKVVRNYACGALAFAKSRESIKSLVELLDHKNAETRDDAKAAIEAIEKGNHHLFADREGTGSVFWNPGEI
jgi:hypothetical protein